MLTISQGLVVRAMDCCHSSLSPVTSFRIRASGKKSSMLKRSPAATPSDQTVYDIKRHIFLQAELTLSVINRYIQSHASSSVQCHGCSTTDEMTDAAAETRAIHPTLSSTCPPYQSCIRIHTNQQWARDTVYHYAAGVNCLLIISLIQLGRQCI